MNRIMLSALVALATMACAPDGDADPQSDDAAEESSDFALAGPTLDAYADQAGRPDYVIDEHPSLVMDRIEDRHPEQDDERPGQDDDDNSEEEAEQRQDDGGSQEGPDLGDEEEEAIGSEHPEDEREERDEDRPERPDFSGNFLAEGANCDGVVHAPVIEMRMHQERERVHAEVRLDADARMMSGSATEDFVELYEGEAEDRAAHTLKVEAILSEDGNRLEVLVRDHERTCTATLLRRG